MTPQKMDDLHQYIEIVEQYAENRGVSIEKIEYPATKNYPCFYGRLFTFPVFFAEKAKAYLSDGSVY